MSGNYYVYVYVDPRNYEEFYFGKGKGSRKHEHLFDKNDSKKVKRINEIKNTGLKPIIRVIAKGLTESEALLVEKTLLWKLGNLTTNVASGHFSDKFRPHNTMHMELSGFDYKNGIFYYNVGEGEHRTWEDFRRFGFISAGQGVRWKDSLKGFQKGDIFSAYLKSHGFVGVGRISEVARPIREVSIQGKPLLSYELSSQNMSDNIDSDDLCEYVCLVEWLSSVGREDAKWVKKSGLYTTTHVRASLDGQPETIEFIEKEFDLDIRALTK
ncbi:GIY-YIG nuclease family protein [Enterovibrio calviensis]|uniref:GIY-YIG nuclease family protein n=1 Tax=Enterovibrio calviensis TaxID=91359 RepID=UPI000483F7D1|nr:GIY-YIG nuclease family protein [Enterovibrio calviensis]